MCLGLKKVGINNNNNNNNKKKKKKKNKKKKKKLNPADVNEMSHEIGMTLAM